MTAEIYNLPIKHSFHAKSHNACQQILIKGNEMGGTCRTNDRNRAEYSQETQKECDFAQPGINGNVVNTTCAASAQLTSFLTANLYSFQKRPFTGPNTLHPSQLSLFRPITHQFILANPRAACSANYPITDQTAR